MQLAGTEHHQHHQFVEHGAAAGDAGLFAHQRARAIATDDVVGGKFFAAGSALFGDGDAHAVGVLRDGRCRPALPHIDIANRRQFRRQHRFHAVLRQAVIVLEVIRPHDFATGRGLPILAREIAVGRDLADRKAGRQQARAAQLVGDAEEIEMLERALGEVLALGDEVALGAAFHQRTGNATLAQIDRQRHAHRPAADDDHLILFFHKHFLKRNPAHRAQTC